MQTDRYYLQDALFLGACASMVIAAAVTLGLQPKLPSTSAPAIAPPITEMKN